MTDLLSSFYLAQVLPLFILSLISSTILLTKLRKTILQAVFFVTGLSLFVVRPLVMSSYQEVSSHERQMLILSITSCGKMNNITTPPTSIKLRTKSAMEVIFAKVRLS